MAGSEHSGTAYILVERNHSVLTNLIPSDTKYCQIQLDTRAIGTVKRDSLEGRFSHTLCIL